VFVNGKNVNELMLEAGYAWVHVGLCTELFCDDWIQIENEVKSEKKGLWADSNRLPPWIWR
jgi:micrococcal nuclease